MPPKKAPPPWPLITLLLLLPPRSPTAAPKPRSPTAAPKPHSPPAAPTPPSPQSTAATALTTAARRAAQLRRTPARRRQRQTWLASIAAYTAIAARYPTTPAAPRALLGAAASWRGLHGDSHRAADLDAAFAALARVTAAYPRTPQAATALWQRAAILRTERHDDLAAAVALATLLHEHPRAAEAAAARALARQLPAAVAPGAHCRVVLDAGHGGHDVGARSRAGLREKDVTLAIAHATARRLQAAGVEVRLTRSDDRFVSLPERTAYANRVGADAFISIHANAAPRAAARGIETYYLNVTDDRYALRLAAVENRGALAQASDLQLVLADLATKGHSEEARALAQRVQQGMASAARPLNPASLDLGVKASLFYVLLGARMPAVLAETSFLSHADEGRLLGTTAYQQHLARGLADAVVQHLARPAARRGA